MKRTTLILSLILTPFILGAASCQKDPASFPNENLFVVDYKNDVCAEYQLVDRKNVKVKLLQEHPLEVCHGVVGYSRTGFKKVQNWVRDAQK